MLSENDLEDRLSAYVSVPLARYPTALQELPTLAREVGTPVYVKRDDEIGPALGGNKTRKLEYLLAEARDRGARRVATFGGLQSNHARITAAAALRCGLEPHLFYFHRRPSRLLGNLRLNEVAGVRMHFVAFGGDEGKPRSLQTTNRLVHWLATVRLGPHYFIPAGGHSWRGCLGYVRAALEIHRQVRDLGIERPWLITAAGTGGTLAGLLAGFRLLGSNIRPLGIDVGRLWKSFPESIAAMASELATRLRAPCAIDPEEVPLVEGRYVGERYGVPSRAGGEAIRRAAGSEGLFLDPVYTGKAFAGMLDLAGQGVVGADAPLIFLHTGGSPGLFAFEGGFVE